MLRYGFNEKQSHCLWKLVCLIVRRQMWFAALGSYHHAPWLVHLAAKLLTAPGPGQSSGGDSRSGGGDGGGDGTSPQHPQRLPPAVALLDPEAFPFDTATGPPLKVRATLWHYDLTRLDLPWSRRQPAFLPVPQPQQPTAGKIGSQSGAVSMAPIAVRAHVNASSSSASSSSLAACAAAWLPRPLAAWVPGGGGRGAAGLEGGPDPAWARVKVGTYLPAVGLGDASLDGFLEHHGWEPTKTTASSSSSSSSVAESWLGRSPREACAAAAASASESASKSARRATVKEALRAPALSSPAVTPFALSAPRCEVVVRGLAWAGALRNAAGSNWRAAFAAFALAVAAANGRAGRRIGRRAGKRSAAARRAAAPAAAPTPASREPVGSRAPGGGESSGSGGGGAPGLLSSLRHRGRPRVELAYEE